MTFSTIGSDAQTGQKVDVDQSVRRAATYIIGSPGTGKSGLMENLILQDIEQGLGVLVIDPHGSLIDNVIGRASKRIENMIYLDLTDYKHPFGINPYECVDTSDKQEVQRRIEAVTHIFERLFDTNRSDTPRLVTYLRNCSHVMVMNNVTMAEIPRLLTDEGYRRGLLQQVTDPQVKAFFKNYDRLKPSEREERADSTINKLDELLSMLVRPIVGQINTTINLRDLMNKRQILLVKLDPRAEMVSTLIGAMILSEVLAAAYARSDMPEKKRKQCNIYLDEFPKYATTDFSLIIAELRKFGVATTFAHQSLEQPGMNDAIRSTAMQAATKIVFRISGSDAQILVNEFEIPLPPPLVVGTRPILTVTQNTIKHLLEKGHKNPNCAPFIQNFLAPTKHMVFFDSFYKKELIRVDTWRPTGEDVALGLFIAVVTHGKNKGVDAAPVIDTPLPEFDRLLHNVQTTHNPNLPLPVVVISGFSNAGGGYNNLITRIDSANKDALEDLGKRLVNAHQIVSQINTFTEKYGRNEYLNNECMNFCTFFLEIRMVMRALAQEPILVNSGQVEPVYGTPRTYADVANEYVQKIANLKNFTALVKLTSGQNTFTTIKTIAPEKFDRRDITRRITQIKENNLKDGYLRRIEDVEKEINDRWNDEIPPIRSTLI